MSDYKNFAIVGVNTLGKHIIDALIEKKNAGLISTVSILTRLSSGHDDLIAKGVKISTVDYASSSSIASALAGVDVIISTIGASALKVQSEIAKVAKAQGVKVFVPSEFGNPTDGATEWFFGIKDGVKKVLRDIGLPYTVFYTGVWTDWYFVKNHAKLFGIDFDNGTADLCGSGTADISFTPQRDTARFIAHVFTTLPKDKLEWRIFRIEGERTSLNKVVAQWEERTGKKVALTHRPRSELEEAVAKNPDDLVSVLALEWDLGNGAVGKPEEVSNNEWPEWNPRNVIDTILAIHGQD